MAKPVQRKHTPTADHWSRKAIPPSQSSLEFELMVRHPISYPTMVPVEAAHVRLEALFNPDISLVDPVLLENDPVSDSTWPQEATNSSPESGTWDYCDERLLLIDMTQWTTVAVTNAFAARAISLYLETDHPLLGLFDADLFLEDLVNGKLNFCSPLLVNALLCWACQAYSCFDWEAAVHSKSFYEEAKQLWLQNNRHTLTAVAASMLLSTAASCHGLVDDAKAFLIDGSAMGKALGLFGVSEPGSAKRWLDHHHDWIRFASHTAWGIETPPLLPIPGDGRKNVAITSDPQLPLAGSNKAAQFHPLPPYMGNTFAAICKLWSIAHRFIWAYYDSEEDVAPTSRASLDTAQECYNQMLDWADRLPLDLVRGDQTTHHTTTCHIYYHAIIADLFRPFLRGTEQHIRLKGFGSEAATPAAVFKASIKQLLRLTLVYRSRFPSASYTFLWHTALLYVANAMLSPGMVTSAPRESRAWFLMCLDGYRDLITSFPITEGIAKGLLSMAMRSRLIKAEEARNIAADMRKKANGSAAEGVSKELLMVDLDLAMVSPLASRVENLAEQFNTLAMWEEFTTEDEDEVEMASE
ncbi:hypothetical protein GQ53DRAFT_644312 [Thozetella sp. PMI_491]|nr:hypothetical protein GQ53DRAFT_644312 [Thozetella sp. PMI_491]